MPNQRIAPPVVGLFIEKAAPHLLLPFQVADILGELGQRLLVQVSNDELADQDSRQEADRIIGSLRADPVALVVGALALLLILILWLLA